MTSRNRNPYRGWVGGWDALMRKGRELPLGGLGGLRPGFGSGSAILLFSPHPDDECVTGALPLRLLRQSGVNVVNVPVTLGTKRERRKERLKELRDACAYLGFELHPVADEGLEQVNPESRKKNPDGWRGKVAKIADVMDRFNPRAVFCPHGNDWNSTHAGVHRLVLDALKLSAAKCHVVETEFWAPLSSPNLMVESSPDDVADLVAATSFHVGEVRRNPYHLLLPAWLMDNVRRGAELVGGQGGEAPEFAFATLYRIRKWNGKSFVAKEPGSKLLSAADDPVLIFENKIANGHAKARP